MWTWIRCPPSAVRSPQSAVRSPQSTRFILCGWMLLILHNVSRRTADRIGQISSLLVSRLVIAMFWKAKISFSLVKNIVFPRLQNMELVWTQKWTFYLKMDRNISNSRGVNMLTQLSSYEPPKWASSLKDIPQFFAQVSSFDITCGWVATIGSKTSDEASCQGTSRL